MRSGELFAGVGGLGMAIDEVFGSSPAWFAEFDAAPSKVLRHHYPDVPNFGDVTQLHNPPPVNILAGGFPCQDVSLAGRRQGLKEGTRSGLWSEFARIIDTVRPDWVVIENVRGLLSADAAGVVEPCPLCVGDNPEHVLRALGAVLGDLAELGFDAEWTGIRASDIGAPHGRFRVFILAWPRERTVTDPNGRVIESGGARSDQRGLSSRDGSSTGTDHPLSLLPTPGAYDGDRGGSQHPDKRRDGGHSVTLQDVAEHALLGTPRTAQGIMNDLRDPNVIGNPRGRLEDQVALMPTPRASRGGSSTETMYGLGAERVDDERPQGQVVADVTDWGPYNAAIRRWEAVTGRPAPAPVRHDGKGGKPRLNPELTEWMMGWPAGWVTGPEIGLTRAEQLKACGNGVVPQQAAAALRETLARPGVPPVRREEVHIGLVQDRRQAALAPEGA